MALIFSPPTGNKSRIAGAVSTVSLVETIYWMQSLDKTDRVIINLKVIAMLQDGQRLCIRNNQFSVWEPGWTQALLRWGMGENRWVNVEEVQGVMHDALRLLGTYMNLVNNCTAAVPSVPVPTPATSLNFVATLARDLEQATTGLQSLRRTYAGDPLMVATLDVLVERTTNEIAKAKEMLAAQQLVPVPVPVPMHQQHGFARALPSVPASASASASVAAVAADDAQAQAQAQAQQASTPTQQQQQQQQMTMTMHAHAHTHTKKGKAAPLAPFDA